jgi:hypothetical protein
MLANAPHLLACCAAVVTIKLLVVVTGEQQHLQHLSTTSYSTLLFRCVCLCERYVSVAAVTHDYTY